MRTTKSFLGLIPALLPILFCGGLLFHLNQVRTAAYGLLDNVLGPTMIGLGAIGLGFLVIFAMKLRRHLTPPAPPKTGPEGLEAALEETKSDFDADAALARYMARRASGSVPMSKPFPPADRPPPGSFGRKGTLG